MAPSGKQHASLGKRDFARLNVVHLDEEARKQGVDGPDAQAAFLGISRAHFYKMRAGDVGATVTTGLRMAHKLHTTVEKLFTASAS